jgi:hypothetical protein
MTDHPVLHPIRFNQHDFGFAQQEAECGVVRTTHCDRFVIPARAAAFLTRADAHSIWRSLVWALQNRPGISRCLQTTDNTRKENTMDFGIILLISNTLMAIFLYIVVKLIWQD